MSDTVYSKWHQELEIFRRIKPCLILEGNILDSYLYPEDGTIPKGTIVRLQPEGKIVYGELWRCQRPEYTRQYAAIIERAGGKKQ